MKISTAIAVILIAIGLMMICPFILIWAINGLFKTTIEYTWMNWFYVVVILIFTKGTKVSSK
jgi:hypothetical protein